jgi:hypothetical protein
MRGNKSPAPPAVTAPRGGELNPKRLKNDFEISVRPGNAVKFYLQLASYELKTKVIMFVVNKYEV